MKFALLLLKLPRWILTGVCLSLIFYLTLVPKPLPDNDIRFWEHTDKIVHGIMFGGLYLCTAVDIWRLRCHPSAVGSLGLALGVVLLGGAIELFQQGMNLGRGGSAGDWIADICGTLIIAILMLRHPKKLPIINNEHT